MYRHFEPVIFILLAAQSSPKLSPCGGTGRGLAIRSLKYIATPFGRAVKNGSAWVYEYNLTDHLGNVRVVIKKGTNNLAEIVQQKGYYSFGMLERSGNPDSSGEISQFSAGTGTSKNWYNGKEIQDDFGLYWYDYGARFYDPMLGRWQSVDPMAEKYNSYSPYHFSGNNPLKFLDLNGMNYDDYTANQNGTIDYKKTDDKFDRFFIENKVGSITQVAQLDKYKAADRETNLVTFPDEGNGFTRYGEKDAGGDHSVAFFHQVIERNAQGIGNFCRHFNGRDIFPTFILADNITGMRGQHRRNIQ